MWRIEGVENLYIVNKGNRVKTYLFSPNICPYSFHQWTNVYLIQNLYPTCISSCINCVPFVYHSCITRVSFVYHLCTICVPFVYHLCTICVPFVLQNCNFERSMMSIFWYSVCSRVYIRNVNFTSTFLKTAVYYTDTCLLHGHTFNAKNQKCVEWVGYCRP